jgi:hypothetical protein
VRQLVNIGASTVLIGFLLLHSVGCGGSPSPSAPSTPSITSVTITGNGTFTKMGDTSQLTATVRMSDGTSQDVTSQSQWRSENDAVASVSATGLVTAKATGQCQIHAVYQTRDAALPVKVDLPTKAIPDIKGTLAFMDSNKMQVDVVFKEVGGSVGYTLNTTETAWTDANGSRIAGTKYERARFMELWNTDRVDAGGAQRIMYYRLDWTTPRSYMKLTLDVVLTDDAGNRQTWQGAWEGNAPKTVAPASEPILFGRAVETIGRR